MAAGQPATAGQQAAPQAPGDQAGPSGPQATGDAGDARIADLISGLVRDIPDYPKPGILFKDITPLLADGAAFAKVIGELGAGHGRITQVAGIEARGFILAAPVALQLGAGFVPIRKQGKLPAPCYGQTYDLEYGTATLEVHQDAFGPSDRVLIVDDVLATGGTANAAAELVRRCGAEVAAVVVLLELGFLPGRSQLPGLDVRALLVV